MNIASPERLPERSPQVGELVQVRSRRWLVEDVTRPAPGESAQVDLACADDDAQGQTLTVYWDYELDRRILEDEGWADLASKGFDSPRWFAAFFHTLRWSCSTATDPGLFQAPFRAGITIDAYQMEPLRKALRLPRVNLFIADDTGLGKTIEAALIARELLLRRKAKVIVVAAPPSVLEQWKGELEERFGLIFEILDRAYVSRMRRERGFGVNPWRTHSRFLVSHNLLIDPAYADPLREWLGPMLAGSLLILDEAHHAAPSSGGRYGIETRFTRAVRDISSRFEHRLFLSATPHNGHSNSFSTLMELLDPYRFTRGIKIRGRRDLDEVMVRRLKEDIRQVQGGFPKRNVERLVVDDLPPDAPELVLAGDVLNEVVHRYRGWLEELRDDDPPLAPFHWQLEFPEVFDRGNPGFDVIVGNPPFAGKNTVIAANRPGYTDWLKQMHADSHGNADLVAHFFRRAFDLMRTDGAFGLISTNTIAQGDTRSTGLRWICENGGEIYRAKRRFKWPGLAAVVVSVLHVWKGRFAGAKHLDDDPVERITAFLFHRGGHTDPARLKANAGKSFQGSIVLGMGFTFDDTDKKGVATPIAEMERLIGEDPRNQEVISPYIGGEEVNKSPAHQHHRYAINFHDFPLQREPLDERWEHADLPARQQWMRQGIVPIDYPHSVATDWWDLLEIVRVRAKPHRDSQKRKALRDRWWQYAEKRPGLYSAIRGLSHVLVTNCGAAPHHAIARMPANMVFAHSLIVVPVHSDAAFCTLQSRPHEIWARFFGSSMKDDLRYTPSDCFETYPFPWGWDKHPGLEAVGKAYYDFRAELMVGNDEGLTKTYNRFHDPDERDPRIEQLRDLHTDMDRAVLNAYGWGDIPTDCGFFLDYEDDEEQSGNRRRKPYRYRWPDEVRDEVLVRLLELNAERAIEERTTSAVSAN